MPIRDDDKDVQRDVRDIAVVYDETLTIRICSGRLEDYRDRIHVD